MPTTITVAVDTPNKTYTITINADDGVIDSGAVVKLAAQGESTVPIAISTPVAPFGVFATEDGISTILSPDQLEPFAMSVAGLTGTPFTVTPKFKIELAADNPVIAAGNGAQVKVSGPPDLTVSTSLNGVSANVFAGQQGGQFTLPSSGHETYTVAATVDGTYLMAGPDQAGVPLKGTINVSSTRKPSPTPKG
jgi:hypothetical protein